MLNLVLGVLIAFKVSTVGELLFRFPSSVIDRSQLSTVPSAVESLREVVKQDYPLV